MAELTATNLFWAVRGSYIPLIRPLTLATDWSWTIVERDNPTVVKDYKSINLPNAQRFDFAQIDSRYTLDVVYEIHILNNVGSVVFTGEFQITEAIFGPLALVDFTEINDQIRLALGLAGRNHKIVAVAHDAVTGIPTEVDITVYTDESLSEVLGVWKLLRRLDKVKRVIAEIQFPTFLAGSSSSGTGTGSTGS